MKNRSIEQWSLKQRLTAVSSIILFIAFSVIYFATQSAYTTASKSRLHESMLAQFYALMAIVQDDEVILLIPDVIRNDRLENLSSGLVAYVLNNDGSLVWQSPSSELFESLPDINDKLVLNKLSESDFEGRAMFWIGESIIWEHNETLEKKYYFIIGEKQTILISGVNAFESQILFWLVLSAVALLIVFSYAVNFSLKPLRKAQYQIELISNGKKKLVEGEFPEELTPLTSSINKLLHSEARQKIRYRDTLGNLAHSLKTPLAIIKGELDKKQNKVESNRQDLVKKNELIQNQVNRINDIVKYQLNRSVISSGQTLVKNCPLEIEAEKIIDALKKVHHDKKLDISHRIETNTIFPGDSGDLLELIGNLTDNACKWAKTMVVLSAKPKDNSLFIYVEDDGPGIALGQREAILDRGKRLDEQTEGQGLGLSIVMDIIKNYQGSIHIETSALGGALFLISIPLN